MTPLHIRRGVCYAIFAYDAARSINLLESEKRIHEQTQREKLRHKRRSPTYFEYEPPPLRVSLEGQSIALDDFSTTTGVDLLVYDFGAVSVIYSIPIAGEFRRLLSLSASLYDNTELLADSRKMVERLLAVIGDAALQANIQSFVEDYVIFHIQQFEDLIPPGRFSADYRHQIAQILRAESRTLSGQETDDALSATISYSTDDLTIVDWNASFVIDPEGDDIRAVLEFANVELLELRYLDHKLDRALNQTYDTVLRRRASGWGRLSHSGSEMRRLAELQVDSAALFEGVNNALKLVGDQYLARAYRLASRRFHLDQWDSTILRKLQTLESIYDKISDQASTQRMEMLEWVIIILIALSIVLPFI